ncbi:MAG TPA: hypothetical protein VK081_10720 [Planctomycetota bacterium]|nr:hypothetical protein [Planctomycetota bacterium]
MNHVQVKEFLLQALETEIGGVRIYETALACARDASLRQKWRSFLDETKTNVEILEAVCGRLGIDTAEDTPGRSVVRDLGRSLERAMRRALEHGGDLRDAQRIACECVGLAEAHGRCHREALAVPTWGGRERALARAGSGTPVRRGA